MNRTPALLCLLLVAASPLRAQSAPTTTPRTVSLADAIATAAQRAPMVAYAAGVREAARGRARVDGAFPNPSLEYRRENDRTPLQPDVFITATLPLDLTGRRIGLRAAGGALVARSAADSAALARDAMMDAARAWWRAALARELAVIAREQQAALEGIATFDETRLREGSVAPVVALRARLEADRAQVARSGAESEAARATAELARAMGFDGDTAVEPASMPLEAPRTTGAVTATIADAVRDALQHRPELAGRQHAVEEASLRLGAERRGVISDLALVGGTKRTSGYDGVQFGVSVPLPLFNLNGGARQQALGALQQAQADLRETQHRVRAEVAGAVRTLDAQRAAQSVRAEQMGARGAEIAQIAEVAYREGGISQLELLEARRASADARAAALRWLVDQHLALLDLRRATGAPILETAP
jgi:cobalt-zinc-cadmium efflux system outer membrane protein